MSDLRLKLRALRSLVALHQRPLLEAVSLIDSGDRNEIIDALHRIFLPTSAELQAAVERWAKTLDTTDGVRALKLAQQPGAGLQFWEWVEKVEKAAPWEIVSGIDRAISRAGR